MMTAFQSAWSVLKNAPVPNYAQPKIQSDGSYPNEITRMPVTQPSPRSVMGDDGDKDRHREKYLQGREKNPYGLAERMPRPDMGHGESSFDSERMNTGTSVFNPSPSWQNVGQGPVGEMYANRLNNMAGEMGTTPPPTPATPPMPTPPLTDDRKIGVQQTLSTAGA